MISSTDTAPGGEFQGDPADSAWTCLMGPEIEMCEVIVYGGGDDYPQFADGFSADDKRNAQAHLKSLESFPFIYALVVLHRVLSYFREPMKKLQGISQDLCSGLKLIAECKDELAKVRGKEDELKAFSERVMDHARRLAGKSGVELSVPRICQRQQHRANLVAQDPKDYYKATVLIPFLDHLLSDLTARFTKHGQKVARLEKLLPRLITPGSEFRDIAGAVEFYYADLLNPDLPRWTKNSSAGRRSGLLCLSRLVQRLSKSV